MKRAFRWLATAALLLAGCEAGQETGNTEAGYNTVRTEAEAPSEGAYERSEEALAILRAADTAVRNARTLRFKSNFNGLFASRGIVGADAVLARGDVEDADLGSVQLRLKAEVEAQDPLFGLENYPDRFTYVMDEENTRVFDPETGVLQYATGADRMAIGNAVNAIGVPQFYRVEPFRFEIAESIGARKLGEVELNGVMTEIVWLKFPDDTGAGEQLFFLGKEDRLPRRVTVMTEETAAGPPALFQTDLEIIDVSFTVAATSFEVAPDQVRERVRYTSADLPIGSRTPEWTLATADGDTISSADLKGNPAMLVFWASWCPSCKAFLPEVHSMYERFAGQGVRFIAINIMDKADPRAFMTEKDYPFELALAGENVLRAYRLIGQPAVVVLDAEGTVVHRQQGARAAEMGNPKIWDAIERAVTG